MYVRDEKVVKLDVTHLYCSSSSNASMNFRLRVDAGVVNGKMDSVAVCRPGGRITEPLRAGMDETGYS